MDERMKSFKARWTSHGAKVEREGSSIYATNPQTGELLVALHPSGAGRNEDAIERFLKGK